MYQETLATALCGLHPTPTRRVYSASVSSTQVHRETDMRLAHDNWLNSNHDDC
jgi:tRNA G26 N,N-dimethylase Trm1